MSKFIKTFENFISDKDLFTKDMVGMGSSRAVYAMGHDVIKRAINEKGIEQNKMEDTIFQSGKYNDIIASINESDTEYKWIVSERLKNIGEDDIEKVIPYFWSLESYILFKDGKYNSKDKDFKKAIISLDNNIFIQRVLHMQKEFKLNMRDLYNRKNYGITKDGKVKLLDYGLGI